MLRGSRPGERRGGRKRDTPNRRTILTERILTIGSDHPTVSWRGFLLKLVKDRKLPADTRMAVAPKCFPAKRTQSGVPRRSRVSAGLRSTTAQGTAAKVGSAAVMEAVVPSSQDWNPQALEALLGIVQDAAADPKARRKAALKIAEFLLPKSSKKVKALPDKYGFAITPKLASEYRNIELEVRSLEREPTRKIPAVAQNILKLTAHSDAIRGRLQCPCPTKYGPKEATQDYQRLSQFTRAHDNKIALSEVRDAEEAHLKARYDTFAQGPEQTARRRRQALQDAERQFKNDPLNRKFSRKDRNDLVLLRWLYPEPRSDFSKRDQNEHDDPEEFEMVHGYHPFNRELPASDGNFYPWDSKLRPASASAADDRLVNAADGSPISPVTPGNALATDPKRAGQTTEVR